MDVNTNIQICQDDMFLALNIWSFGPVEDSPLRGGIFALPKKRLRPPAQ